ncbi:hypothetical protein [Emticicia fluvialis]|uniref:hypothetical protein n=1 Tax=Emticicia fluvialis TaxID=2974474 RepID=UPI0021658D73|nr:hypothetical protein [Emticicia fluvialis]
MKFAAFVFVLFFSITLASAQEANVQEAMVYNALPGVDGTPGKNRLAMGTYDLRYEGVKGSRYFLEEWLNGELVFVKENTKAPKMVPLKYDTHRKELLFKRTVGDSIVVNPDQITGFVINDTKNSISYPFIKVDGLRTEGGVVPVTYLLVLYKSKTSLLKHVSKMMQKANYQGAYSVDRRYDSYLDNSEYYLKKPDGSLNRVKLKKNSVLNALEEKKDAIEAFIKKEELALKSEYDLVRIVDYYNSL